LSNISGTAAQVEVVRIELCNIPGPVAPVGLVKIGLGNIQDTFSLVVGGSEDRIGQNSRHCLHLFDW
jgi:hypothetical protein